MTLECNTLFLKRSKSLQIEFAAVTHVAEGQFKYDSAWNRQKSLTFRVGTQKANNARGRSTNFRNAPQKKSIPTTAAR